MNDYYVYVHTTPNNKKYIGISKLKPIVRWGKHGSGYNRQKYFHNAILKYGWDTIKHEILYENLSEKDAKLMEIYLIKFYKTNDSRFGYNCTNGGDGTSGISRFGNTNGRARKVICTTTGEIFNTILDACNSYNLSFAVRRHISEVCRGSRIYSGIYNGQKLQWKYYQETEILE